MSGTIHWSGGRNSPGYQAGLWSTDYRFRAGADTARTFRCVRPAGTTASQYGLKVTNLTVAIDDDNVFGRTAWAHPGALYG